MTSALLWKATGFVALIDLPLVLVVALRVPHRLFASLRWHLTAAAALVFAALWLVLGSFVYWDDVYSRVFPAWSRWALPVWFAALEAGAALAFWWISRRARRWPAAWFVVLGGLVSVPGHWIGIRRGLLRVPMLSQASAPSALIFGIFEFVVYWCLIVGLAAVGYRVGQRRRPADATGPR